MFGFPSFLMTPQEEKRQRERDQRERAERLAKGGVPWDPKMKWEPHMTIKADTWMTWDLFDVKPTKLHNPNHEKSPEGKFHLSPSEKFMFCKKVLKRGERIGTLSGSKQGDVMFDGDIHIPALHERTGGGDWQENPWMSITPMGLMTQRPGIRFAKGHVVIAGLGLGWMLVEVLKKKTVTKVTLVERSQELVDWVMPAIAPMIRNLGKDMDTIVDDAYVAVPKLKADVALIDIFPSYGSNDFLDDLYLKAHNDKSRPRDCPNIGRVWSWGKAHIGDGGW